MAEEAASTVVNRGLDSLVKDPRATQDFSKEADSVIVTSRDMAKAGRLDDALDALMALEKKARQSSDAATCSRLLIEMATLLYNAKQFDRLLEMIHVMTKKRGQLKRAVADLVHVCMGWLDTFDRKQQYAMVDALSEVTEGKIFVEVERARLRLRLAHMKEEDGDPIEAANIIQDEQIETCGAMEKNEKAEYILEQMRMVLRKGDYISKARTDICEDNLYRNANHISEDQSEDARERSGYLVRYWLHEKNYLEVYKCYRAILDTKKTQEDEAMWTQALESSVLYLLLSPYSNEQSDSLYKLRDAEKKRLESVPVYSELLDSFLAEELVPTPVPNEDVIKAYKVFNDAAADKEPEYLGGEERWNLFRKRVVQHNIVKVAAVYYTRIHTTSLAKMIGVSVDETEKEVCELVTGGFLAAKIDRPAGIVRFGKRLTTTQRLDKWGSDIHSLLDLVESTGHLIAKEQMISAARAKMRARAATTATAK
ncbi:26S proteasome non-ATPase regulatory subunit 12 [Perkinsus chesapeaki]|uniref:26S proteasome non-ATPase regulatory subunit 12 n=1 Tax=Perkinsus chesapeaki TaxID=330153 RepID=A0A7J6M8U3_PERCH|nr:26S proteasome non-ATPase regulatory subunit 12 [Perkinsus chesapeaki]